MSGYLWLVEFVLRGTVLQINRELFFVFGRFRDDGSCVRRTTWSHVPGCDEVAVLMVVLVVMVVSTSAHEGSRKDSGGWSLAKRRVLKVHEEGTFVDNASACKHKMELHQPTIVEVYICV